MNLLLIQLKNNVFCGKIQELSEEKKKFIQNLPKFLKEELKEKEEIVRSRPSLLRWFLFIAFFPALFYIPFAIIIFLQGDSETRSLSFYFFIIGVVFYWIEYLIFKTIKKSRNSYLAILNEVFIQKIGDEVKIIPYREIKDIKIEVLNNLPTLFIEFKQGSIEKIKEKRNLSPISSSVGPLFYKFHLSFSVSEINFPISVFQLKQKLEEKIKNNFYWN